MIRFSNIRQGINHQRMCPICRNELGVPNVVYESDDLKAQLIHVPFQVGNVSSVAVDIDSGIVKAVSPWKDGEPALLPYGFKSGDIFQGITIECSFCTGFSYTLLLKFYAGDQIVLNEVCLNSEQVRVKLGKFIHSIRNVHSLNETTYRCVNLQEPTDIKQETIPLVPLNLQNPRETLARIKKLLVFS